MGRARVPTYLAGMLPHPSNDTSADAAAVQAEAIRRLTPEARVALALEASDWLQRLAQAGPAGSARRAVPRDDSEPGHA